jgi:3-methylornithyl-N6-L-lysine dehydrogenase
MTRLTPSMISDVPRSLEGRDDDLMETIGVSLKGLAYSSVGVDEKELDIGSFRAAAVPVTSGKGVTSGFCDSVKAIIQHLGMDSFVTGHTDVAGLAEALQRKADIVFMADDLEFIALNVQEHRFSDNTHSTALGYTTALDRASGGVRGKEVLVVGAGRVGTCAIEMLLARGAKVRFVEAEKARAAQVEKQLMVVAEQDFRKAVERSRYILNASPARIPGEWISEGAIVSSPGMPYSFDEAGERKMHKLIHDPLQIGVAVMAVWSASFSMAREQEIRKGALMGEVLQ